MVSARADGVRDVAVDHVEVTRVGGIHDAVIGDGALTAYRYEHMIAWVGVRLEALARFEPNQVDTELPIRS